MLLLESCCRIQNLLLPRCSRCLIRLCSSQKFTKTILLPKTRFEHYLKPGKRVARDKEIHAWADFDNLYEWQRNRTVTSKGSFVLHDGPPYANGEVHVGHAVNKILKDITARYKMMQGYQVHFRPGWDCHGLPIEQKVLEKLNRTGDFYQIDPMEIRQLAKAFAESAVASQRTEFRRWGVMADWENPYLTSSPEYEARELEIFKKLWASGLIYRDFRPTYFSPSSRSTLAGAEVEHNPEHVSPSVFVKFPLLSCRDSFPRYTLANSEQLPLYALIWTTTPWTLPCNDAICYNPFEAYCFARAIANFRDELWLVARKSIAHLQKELGYELSIVGDDVSTSEMEGLRYKPMFSQDDQISNRFYPSHHASGDIGTGLVHTAFAHGLEDFAVAQQFGLIVRSLVDGKGQYSTQIGLDLAGISVLGERCVLLVVYDGRIMDRALTNDSLIEGSIVHRSTLCHSYPYDWRTRKPVIIRASEQWFIDTRKLKDEAVNLLQQVHIVPENQTQSFLAHLEKLPPWCISRQRAWGVPIPVFSTNESNSSPFTQEIVIDHLIDLIRKHGSDVWWVLPIEDLFPVSLRDRVGIASDVELTRCSHILDIWFDSGVSWFASDLPGVADLVVEGHDQFRGWFQSLLVTSIASRNVVPYRSILVHGFVQDETGRKMSKSLGNVVKPCELTDANETNDSSRVAKDAVKCGALGVDGLRLWVALNCQESDIRLGADTVAAMQTNLLRLRNLLKFVLGSLSDFRVTTDYISCRNLRHIDRFMLAELSTVVNASKEAFDSLEYSTVVKLVLSNPARLYLSVIKDRLYCEAEGSLRRRAAQTVLYEIGRCLTNCLSPILPHLAEEYYMFLPNSLGTPRASKLNWFDFPPEWEDATTRSLFSHLLPLQDKVAAMLGDKQQKQMHVTITNTSMSQLNALRELQAQRTSCDSELTELLDVSCVTVNDDSTGQLDNHEATVFIEETELKHCPRCRRYNIADSRDLCARCEDVLALSGTNYEKCSIN